MKPRLAVAMAVLAGAALLAPVIAVVALGAYGSAMEAAPVSGRGPELRLLPEAGPPNTEVRLIGKDWPPRRVVSLFLVRPPEGDASDEMRLRIGSGATSAAGEFEIGIVIPRSLAGPDPRLLSIEGEVAAGEGQLVEKRQAPYVLLPHPAALAVRVLSAGPAIPLEGAEVTLLDSFGSRTEPVITAADGWARLSAVPPGAATLRVRRHGHRVTESAVQVPATGMKTVEVGLEPASLGRLYLPYAEDLGGAAVTLHAIDRASGLAVRETLDWPAAHAKPVADKALGLDYFYLLASDPAPSTAVTPHRAPPAVDRALAALVAAAQEITPLLPAWPMTVSHVGFTPHGSIVFAKGVIGDFILYNRLVLVLPVTGPAARDLDFSSRALPPVITPDGASVLVVDWFTKQLFVVDVASWRVVRRIGGLPDFVESLAMEPSGTSLLLLTGDSGSLYRFDLNTGTLNGPLASFTGAGAIAMHPDGKRVFVVGPKMDFLALVDIATGVTVALAPLEAPARWVWPDPTGPYVYVQQARRPRVQILDISTLANAGAIDFPAPAFSPPSSEGLILSRNPG